MLLLQHLFLDGLVAFRFVRQKRGTLRFCSSQLVDGHQFGRLAGHRYAVHQIQGAIDVHETAEIVRQIERTALRPRLVLLWLLLQVAGQLVEFVQRQFGDRMTYHVVVVVETVVAGWLEHVEKIVAIARAALHRVGRLRTGRR